MLKNRAGVVVAASLPEGKCTCFRTGDILLSNIRPYFKKIWLSTFDGGCSNDVLCISAKKGVKSEFVYSSIVGDDFFDYVMAGSNGVKMPRGDKSWIMKYPVCVPSRELLCKYNDMAEKLLKYKSQLTKENALLQVVKVQIRTRLSQL